MLAAVLLSCLKTRWQRVSICAAGEERQGVSGGLPARDGANPASPLQLGRQPGTPAIAMAHLTPGAQRTCRQSSACLGVALPGGCCSSKQSPSVAEASTQRPARNATACMWLRDCAVAAIRHPSMAGQAGRL